MADVNFTQVQEFLSGADYPVSKDELLESARTHGADEKVLGVLDTLPEGYYQTPAQVCEALGRVE